MDFVNPIAPEDAVLSDDVLSGMEDAAAHLTEKLAELAEARDDAHVAIATMESVTALVEKATETILPVLQHMMPKVGVDGVGAPDGMDRMLASIDTLKRVGSSATAFSQMVLKPILSA